MRRLQKEFPLLWKLLRDAVSKGIDVCTDYSAVGTLERACILVERAVVACAEEDGSSSKLSTSEGSAGFRFHRACDIDVACRRALHSLPDGDVPGSDRHPCVLGDICERITVATRRSMETRCAEFELRLNDNALIQSDALLPMLQDLLKMVEADETFQSNGLLYCFKHAHKCSLHGDPSLPRRGSRTELWGGGNCCQAWSSIGQQTRWLGDATIPLIIWIANIKSASGPDVLVQECTKRFDVTTFRKLLGSAFKVMERTLCPTELGLPVRRERKWTISVRRERRHVRFEFCDPLFDRVFYRTLESNGAIYLTQGEEGRVRREEELHARARRLSIPATRVDGNQWSFIETLNPGYRQRLLAYKDQAKEAIAKGACDASTVHVVNLEQDASAGFGQHSFVVPTLLRNSTIVKLDVDGDADELLTSMEHFTVMGWPSCGGYKSQPSLKDVISSFSDRERRKMTGNAMHVEVCGVVVIHALLTSAEELDDETSLSATACASGCLLGS